MTTYVRLTFYDNEHWVIDAEFQDLNLIPVPLTGVLIEWSVGSKTYSTASGEITLTDEDLGLARISVPPASHAELVPGVYKHEALLTLTTGVKRIFFAGDFKVLDGIT